MEVLRGQQRGRECCEIWRSRRSTDGDKGRDRGDASIEGTARREGGKGNKEVGGVSGMRKCGGRVDGARERQVLEGRGMYRS